MIDDFVMSQSQCRSRYGSRHRYMYRYVRICRMSTTVPSTDRCAKEGDDGDVISCSITLERGFTFSNYTKYVFM